MIVVIKQITVATSSKSVGNINGVANLTPIRKEKVGSCCDVINSNALQTSFDVTQAFDGSVLGDNDDTHTRALVHVGSGKTTNNRVIVHNDGARQKNLLLTSNINTSNESRMVIVKICLI